MKRSVLKNDLPINDFIRAWMSPGFGESDGKKGDPGLLVSISRYFLRAGLALSTFPDL